MTHLTLPPPELLAPAGCFASLQAAIDAGADAVYFGLAQLNMRARARRTFELGDLAEITERLHAAGKKAYLTLNTLLYEHDYALCQSLLKEAAKRQVDGVIISDMAAVMRANELGLEVHLSTQLSLSNYEAVAFYAPYCTRVVLARELNLSMIKKIYGRICQEGLVGRTGKRMEIEAFAHGALCIAVSGRCGMSLFTSNGSANRGACEQNCRKAYQVTDPETKKSLIVDNHFIMSPNDIAVIDFLDTFLASGIQVLKIEGRGRSPEYVSTVTGVYRAGIDAVLGGTYNQAWVEGAFEQLKGVYNRGLSSGYYLGREQGWSQAYGSKATQRKVLVGKINHVYPKIGVVEISRTACELSTQESLLVIGNKTGVLKPASYQMRVMEENSRMVESLQVSAGQTITLQFEGKVRAGDMLYKLVAV